MWECRYRVPLTCSLDFLVRLRLGRAMCCLCERAGDDAARKVNFEGVVLEAFGVTQQQVRRIPEGGLANGPPTQRRFRSGVAPRLVRYATERKPRLLDGLAFEYKPGGDRNERERIGQA